MKAQDPQSTKVITCPFDKDTPKAEFTISTSLPVGVRNRFMDIFMDVSKKITEEENVKTSELYGHYRELVKVGLKGLVNVYDPTGKTLAVNGTVSDEVLNHLSEMKIAGSGFDNIINWLGTEVWRANTLQEEEKKE
jgi:hypothetical protein